MYKKLINPNEEEVNNVLKEGYYLHSINLSPAHGLYDAVLIYHFIKDYVGFSDVNSISPDTKVSYDGLEEPPLGYNV